MYRVLLTPPHDEFKAIFGSNITFGSYLNDLSPVLIAKEIVHLTQDSEKLASYQIRS